MIKTFTQKFEFTWFYISLLCFVVVLPFSLALVSIFGGVILFAALVEDNWNNKIARLKQNKVLLLIPGIFLIYVLSSILLYKNGNPFYDLKKSMFFLVIPFAFILGKPINSNQKRLLFFAFTFAVLISSIVAVINWIFKSETVNFAIHKISLISHIRFSFQLILIFWFLIILIQTNRKKLNFRNKTWIFVFALYFLGFLIFQQSLTGLIAFGSSLLFYSTYLLVHYNSKYRNIYLSLVYLIILTPVFYVGWVIYTFYDIEKIDKDTIAQTTSQGNDYLHDFENKAVENGHYTYLYVCHDEMRLEWNKISKIKYDDITENGYPLYSTLIRYLTSKGLRKDAEGVNSLTSQDIQNVENEYSNFIFQNKKYSIYPRIYQTVWEFYMYSQTGDPSYQSFSQRIEYSKAALLIIKSNFWFGVGTGNWEEEFKETYIANNSKLVESLYASSHNQYLNYMVKFGFIGLLAILFFIIYPVIKTKSYVDPLFLIFLIFLTFANFADSNFESHMGSSFFIFFYCLFVILPGDTYLKIPEKTD